MTEQVRYRIDKRLVKEARLVCEELGIDPTVAVSMFFAQMVKVRGLPFLPTEFPALREYGATLADADRAEAAALAEIRADRKAGRMRKFTGKLVL